MKIIDVKTAGGFTFHVWVSPEKLPFLRSVKYMEFQDNAHWHVSPTTVDLYQKNIIDLAKMQKCDEIIKLASHMDELRAMETTVNQVLEYANLFIMMPGEPHDHASSEWYEKKKLLAKDPEILAFFLSTSAPFLKNLKDSQIDIVAYLMETGRVQVEKRLLFLIGRPVSLIFNKA